MTVLYRWAEIWVSWGILGTPYLIHSECGIACNGAPSVCIFRTQRRAKWRWALIISRFSRWQSAACLV